jgi:hypothetical protein
VVWPRRGSRLEDESVPTERQFYSEELKAQIRARHAASETIPALAQSTGIPFATVKFLCGHGKKRDAEPAAVLERSRRRQPCASREADEERGRHY